MGDTPVLTNMGWDDRATERTLLLLFNTLLLSYLYWHSIGIKIHRNILTVNYILIDIVLSTGNKYLVTSIEICIYVENVYFGYNCGVKGNNYQRFIITVSMVSYE